MHGDQDFERPAPDAQGKQVAADRRVMQAAAHAVRPDRGFAVLPGERAGDPGHLALMEARRAVFHQREMTGITGTLAWQDGKPSIRAHGVGGGLHYTTVGGHLLALSVGRGSLEVLITVHEQRLERRKDPETGANILQLK